MEHLLQLLPPSPRRPRRVGISFRRYPPMDCPVLFLKLQISVSSSHSHDATCRRKTVRAPRWTGLVFLWDVILTFVARLPIIIDHTIIWWYISAPYGHTPNLLCSTAYRTPRAVRAPIFFWLSLVAAKLLLYDTVTSVHGLRADSNQSLLSFE